MVYTAQIRTEEFREELNTTGFGKEATDYLSRGAGGSPISVSFFYIKIKNTEWQILEPKANTSALQSNSWTTFKCQFCKFRDIIRSLEKLAPARLRGQLSICEAACWLSSTFSAAAEVGLSSCS